MRDVQLRTDQTAAGYSTRAGEAIRYQVTCQATLGGCAGQKRRNSDARGGSESVGRQAPRKVFLTGLFGRFLPHPPSMT